MKTKLNLGCGKDIREGCINLDNKILEGVDIVYDLNEFPYPFQDNQFEEIISFGCIELIDADFIKIMEELYRITKPSGIIKIRCPAFPNMCSVQDPLTKHFIMYNSFNYFLKEGGLDYYSKIHFRIKKREYIFSINKFKFVNPLINIFPKFYSRFVFNIFPATTLYFELEVIK